jgi:hypothetical protein
MKSVAQDFDRSKDSQIICLGSGWLNNKNRTGSLIISGSFIDENEMRKSFIGDKIIP